MPTLPFDIHVLIMENFYRLLQDGNLHYPTLAACALVCKAWLPIAQRLLYRRLNRPRPSGGPFVSYVPQILRSVANNPHLGTYTRFIAIDDVARFEPEQQRSAPKRDSDDIKLLGLCPSIEGIIIKTSLRLSWWPEGLETRLHALNLKPTFLEADGHPTLLARLMDVWPNLRYLCSAYSMHPDFTQFPQLKLPYGVQLYGTGNMLSILSSPSDNSSVREIAFFRPQWHDPLCVRTLDPPILGRLHSLTIVGDVPPPAVLERLTELETLVFTELFSASISLPQTIRKIGYHRDDVAPYHGPSSDGYQALERSLGLFIDALSTLPRLELLTVTRFSSKEVRAALEDTAHSLGVAFVVYYSGESISKFRFVDWL